MNGPAIKVSVILPVYNPGTGIIRCIDCLRNQSLKEIEMIFVDDCGTDDAIEYVKKAAESDPRIRLLKNPQNLGAGPSRNRGIEAASGEYLSFVDPDDYISERFLELLYCRAAETKADIVKGICKTVDENKDSEPAEDTFSLNEKIREGLKGGFPLYTLFTFQHWTAIYRRGMVISRQVRYADSSYSEDAAFLLKACANASRIEFAEEAVYYYVSRGESSVRDFSVSRWQGEMTSLKDMLDHIVKKQCFTPEGYRFAISHIVNVLDLQKYFDDREETREDAGRMMEEIRETVKNLPFRRELMDTDVVIDVLMKYKRNLSPIPYGWQWRWIPYREYKSRVDLWVNFLRKHPEQSSRCRLYLWRVFENAIDYDGWDKETEYQKGRSLKEIRRRARQLPDRGVLTKDFISMKLFVDHGIDTFSLRRTKLGDAVKRLAAIVRNSG